MKCSRGQTAAGGRAMCGAHVVVSTPPQLERLDAGERPADPL